MPNTRPRMCSFSMSNLTIGEVTNSLNNVLFPEPIAAFELINLLQLWPLLRQPSDLPLNALLIGPFRVENTKWMREIKSLEAAPTKDSRAFAQPPEELEIKAIRPKQLQRQAVSVNRRKCSIIFLTGFTLRNTTINPARKIIVPVLYAL